MKFLVFAIVLISFSALALTQSRQNTIRWGNRKQSDVLIGHYVAIKKAKSSWFSSKAVNQTLQYPAMGQLGRNISAIYFYEAPKGRANPKLLSGGIGRNYTTILLTSQKGQGLNVTVELYGPQQRWSQG
ncbi:hypothetical protein CpipJ_CPIJ015171 [Culex quinquefasciatus]|uniref:Salivary secreted peptide n=1 Tax=Culex quinquefasciatus TaxID=7176 RepID=B0X7L8_CULQU|nr:hypothetical protein CpipJ_CPIJ015171 [Culex quinquefasciatus]|eukprot:XP_001865640.1 hypothetical protein CpipJ_CPIJ015171 [Culex quinquefasciatus]